MTRQDTTTTRVTTTPIKDAPIYLYHSNLNTIEPIMILYAFLYLRIFQILLTIKEMSIKYLLLLNLLIYIDRDNFSHINRPHYETTK